MDNGFVLELGYENDWNENWGSHYALVAFYMNTYGKYVLQCTEIGHATRNF